MAETFSRCDWATGTESRKREESLDALGAGLYIADQKESAEWNRLTSI